MVIKILLLVTSILFIILSSWSLHTYNKLGEVDQSQVETLCGVTADSIKNGRNFSLIMLLVSIAVFLLIAGQYAYGQYNPKALKMGYGKMKYAF